MTQDEQWQALLEPLESERTAIQNDMDYLESQSTDGNNDTFARFDSVILKIKLRGRHRLLSFRIDEIKQARERGDNALLWRLGHD